MISQRSLTGKERKHLLDELGALLDQARSQGRRPGYLEVADALAIEAPLRIHKTTRLLEILLKRDAEAGRPLRSLLVVSKTRPGEPAEGLFERARRLGLFDDDPDAFYRRELTRLLPDR